MATYKVIQDIEAEDHILGPLTLRQFLYGLATAFFGYLNFISIIKHVDFLVVIFLPPMLLAGFFAFPFKSDQPTEVWALARIRFMLKPRKRLWSQSGVKELVSITAPKKQARQLTNGLSRNEVNDRLKSLALVIDSRGWAVKNVSPFVASQLNLSGVQSDRLVDASSIPTPVPEYSVTPEEDIFDEVNNPLAAQMNSKIEQSTRQHRQAIIQSLNTIRGQQEAQNNQSAIQPPLEPSKNEKELTDALKSRTALNNLALSNMHNLEGNDPQPSQKVQPKPQTITQPVNSGLSQTTQQTVQPTSDSATSAKAAHQNTTSTNAAILNLANNDDRSIASLAREAEVVINLH